MQEVDFRVGGVKPNISLLSVQGTNNSVFNLLFLFHPPTLGNGKTHRNCFYLFLEALLGFFGGFLEKQIDSWRGFVQFTLSRFRFRSEGGFRFGLEVGRL